MIDTPLEPRAFAAVVRRARDDERALLMGLTEEERTQTGTPQALSAKDLVAHVTAAKVRNLWKLEAAARGEAAPNFDEHENAQIFAEHQHRTWQDVESEAERVCGRLTALVEGLTLDQLNSLQPDPCEGERALWRQLLFPLVWHVYGHLTSFYLERGEAVRAVAVHEALAETVRELNVPGPLLGCVLYNLACAYAVTGRGRDALRLLPEALRLDAGLIEISRGDGDLDSLRHEPAFQQLVAA